METNLQCNERTDFRAGQVGNYTRLDGLGRYKWPMERRRLFHRL